MRTLRNKAGFTLVELIVVIAILGILAGVAIPVYNGYIKKAQDATVISELDAIQTAAQAANATAGNVEKITVAPVTTTTDDLTDATITIEATKQADIAKFDADFEMFLQGAEAVKEEGTDKWGTFTYTFNFDGSYGAGAEWTLADGWNAK